MIAVGNGSIGKAIEFAHHCRFGLGGGRIYLTPEIRSYYHCRDTLKGLWRQNFANGKEVIYTKVVVPYALSWRHFIPFIFVASLIGSISLLIIPLLCLEPFFASTIVNNMNTLTNPPESPFAKPESPFAKEGLRGLMDFALHITQFCFGRLSKLSLVLPAGILGCYALANALSSAMLSYKHGFRYFFVLPVVFATLHFSYGLGSIWGLLTLKKWIAKNTLATKAQRH